MTGRKKNKFIILLILFLININALKSNLSKDYLLINGEESLISYGMDTTFNWWAITSPFDKHYKLYINGEDDGVYSRLTGLTFSSDGDNWAYFAYDNVQLFLITPDTIIKLVGNKHGVIVFSPNSEVLVYSYFVNNEEFIHHKNNVIRAMYRSSDIYINYDGTSIAFYEKRLSNRILNIDGIESLAFQNIHIFGFWHTGELLFAGGTTNYVEIYKGKKVISDAYSSIRNLLLNRYGTVASFIGTDFSGESFVILLSNEYNQPIISKRYDVIETITLHPSEPIIAAKARNYVNYLILYNSIEYYAGRNTNDPQFTHDGSEMYYIYCELSCFLVKNGKKYRIDNNSLIYKTVAIKPNSSTYAYTTNSTLILSKLESNEYITGMMVDETSEPRYNWRTNSYEALGRINNRLYLLTITSKD